MADAVYIPRLKRTYDETIRQALTEQFGYKNQMEVPVLDKIVLNMGVGETVADGKKINSAVGDLTLIAGQKPVVTKAVHRDVQAARGHEHRRQGDAASPAHVRVPRPPDHHRAAACA